MYSVANVVEGEGWPVLESAWICAQKELAQFEGRWMNPRVCLVKAVAQEVLRSTYNGLCIQAKGTLRCDTFSIDNSTWFYLSFI